MWHSSKAKVKRKNFVGVLHLRHHSPTHHTNLHSQMQNPLRFHRSLVPALSGVGHSIPKSKEPENLEIVAGMLCPYECFLTAI